jgi:hypothetical protein
MGPTTFRRAWPLALAALLSACGRESTAPVAPPATPPPPPAPVVATQLPLLRISTTNRVPITSRETYVGGSYRLTDTTGTLLAEGALEIRGRGNSTWGMPKKPYRVRLATSTALAGMPASRHWVLLANYSDKTLLRNDLAFALSRAMGFAWTPRTVSVEVELNGSYDGIYQLVEHVRIAPDRVNIPELRAADTTAATVSGGYLIEVDERWGEAFCRQSTMTPMVFCFSNPETLGESAWRRQREYITTYLARTDSAIFGPRFADPALGYAAWLDVPSAIDYWILQELARNVDGNLRLSTYLFKPRDGKLTFGPMWDFDIAFGNVDYGGADAVEGWQIRPAPWFARLFQDPAFAARVRARWAELVQRGVFDGLFTWTRQRREFLSRVQARNFERWPILGQYVWPNRVVTGSYPAEVAAMEQWLWSRYQWMDRQLR